MLWGLYSPEFREGDFSEFPIAPVLTGQNYPGVPAANFPIILCRPSSPVVGLPLADRG